MFVIDAKERKIIITNNISREVTEIREGESLKRKFLEGTQDKYECVLKLEEVDIVNPENSRKNREKRT